MLTGSTTQRTRLYQRYQLHGPRKAEKMSPNRQEQSRFPCVNPWPVSWIGVVLSLFAATLFASAPAVGIVGFEDVPVDRYYSDAVAWSVENNITDISETCFRPGEPISRGETALYIWNMEGRPDSPASSFRDVLEEPESSAVNWLSYADITTGAAPTRFSPHKTLTRVEIAAFLYRLAGRPSAPAHAFNDVEGDWQNDAVSWMSDTEITTGTARAIFSPNKTLTRGELITFLYRYKGSPAVSGHPERSLGDSEGQRSATRVGRRPLVAIESDTSLAVEGRFDIGISFSEPVIGLTECDLFVVNGRVVSFSGDGSDYTANIEAGRHGTVMVKVPAAVALSAGGLPNEASSSLMRVNSPDSRGDAPGINTLDRERVIDEYLQEYNRPDFRGEDRSKIGWTGSVADCIAGTTNQSYRDSIIQRINWFRRMAGLKPVEEDPALSEQAQAAALMMAAEDRLSHVPDSDWACYSREGFTGAYNSNLGPGVTLASVDTYMEDYGRNNIGVGHRNWILLPGLRTVGWGAAYVYPSGWSCNCKNALWVQGRRHALVREQLVREELGFVPWPPAGYVPEGVVWPRWSLGMPENMVGGTNTLDVTVISESGVSVPVQILHAGSDAVVWKVIVGTGRVRGSEPQEHCYAVRVSGVELVLDFGFEPVPPFEYPVCVLHLPHAWF